MAKMGRIRDARPDLLFVAFGQPRGELWLAANCRDLGVPGCVQVGATLDFLADVMDPHPVTLDGATTVLEAREQVFDPHPDWPFVALVDESGRYLGVLRRDVLEQELASGRPALPVRDAVEGSDDAIATDQPLEALLAAQGLRAFGAVFAVDHDGMLRGVVTLDMLRRALTPAGGR